MNSCSFVAFVVYEIKNAIAWLSCHHLLDKWKQPFALIVYFFFLSIDIVGVCECFAYMKNSKKKKVFMSVCWTWIYSTDFNFFMIIVFVAVKKNPTLLIKL